jgi:hypothetical protein
LAGVELAPSLTQGFYIQVLKCRELLIERTHGHRPQAGTR